MVISFVYSSCVTEYGRPKIEEAKKNGQWDAPKSPVTSDEQLADVKQRSRTDFPLTSNMEVKK